MPKNNHKHNNLVVIVIIRVVKVQEAYVDCLLRFLTILNDLHIPDNPEYNTKNYGTEGVIFHRSSLAALASL